MWLLIVALVLCSALKFLNKLLAFPWINTRPVDDPNWCWFSGHTCRRFPVFLVCCWFLLIERVWIFHVTVFQCLIPYAQAASIVFLPFTGFAVSTSDSEEDSIPLLSNFGALFLLLQFLNMMESLMVNTSKSTINCNSFSQNKEQDGRNLNDRAWLLIPSIFDKQSCCTFAIGPSFHPVYKI